MIHPKIMVNLKIGESHGLNLPSVSFLALNYISP